MEFLKGKKIILASNSPRRRELLAGLDIDFEVDAKTDFKESISPDMPPFQIPAMMSEGKSLGFHRPLQKDEILITSDTMVFCNGEILGKPHSREDAQRMLHLLSDNSHSVVTAVTIRDTEGLETFSDRTEVHFCKLTDEEIDYYIDNYRPFDKAGAYGIQEWIGFSSITHLEGSVYTVIGLPVHLLYQRLKNRYNNRRITNPSHNANSYNSAR